MNTENACAGKTRVSFTLKGKLILGFLAVILIMLCVLIYSVYEVLEPQLVETQLDMQTRYAQILARAIWDWKEEMEQASATLTVSDEIQRFLRMSADERQSYEQQIAALLYQQLDAYEGWKYGLSANPIRLWVPPTQNPFVHMFWTGSAQWSAWPAQAHGTAAMTPPA